MPETISNRLKHAWNAFKSRDPTFGYRPDLGTGSSRRQDRTRLHVTNERSIIVSVYNRIALDTASVLLQHVRLDQNGRYAETINSGLNYILTQEANIDQTHRAFIQDLVMSMFDEGVVAAVPIDTDLDITTTNSFEIVSMRTGKITQWFPQNVKVKVYNDRTGMPDEIILPKSKVAIIENPLYAVMNEPNGTLKRLIKKLSLLDAIDEQSGAGKLDLIIQLPYVIKTEARKLEAEKRRKDIEFQLSGSRYGVAYTDGTERITQLNRPVENNLMAQIQYLTSMLYSQLGLTEEVFNGKADEAAMLNYYNRTIIPIITAIIDEFKRKFLTKTARTQNQSIMYFKDSFSLVPAKELAEIADKFTRNEILSPNEVRSIIGYKPDKNPKSDELANRNMPGVTPGQSAIPTSDTAAFDEQNAIINEILDGLSADIDTLLGEEDEDE